MANFAIDVGHRRIICVEAYEKFVEINSYSTLPSNQVVKVSSRSLKISLECWKKFNDNLELIKKAFTIFKDHPEEKTDFTLNLGKLLQVTAVSGIGCVHIRKYYFDTREEKVKPGRPGIAFKISEFSDFLENIENINQITNLEEVETCCTSETQKNCPTCSY